MQTPRFAVAILSMGVMFPGMVFGQDYPSRNIRIICGPAGGGGDFVARQIAQGIAGPLGQSVIVDNRGTGPIAAEAAFKEAPDGYALLVSGSILWTIPLLRKAPYGDFLPITQITREINVLVVHPSLPVKSVKELIALAKSKPGELNYGSTVAGGTQQLGLELFKSMAGVNIVHVPYKGAGPIFTALISGEVQLTIYDTGVVAPHVKAGKLRALAITNAEPSVLVPGLPTIASAGLPGYELAAMTGILAPLKTPTAVINRLNQEIVRLLARQDVKERFLSAGVETVGNSPDQFAAIIKADIARWTKVIKDAGIKAD